MKKLEAARQAVGMLMQKNTAARHRALETFRYRADGTVRVKIGGKIRGKWHAMASRAAAVRAVNLHYDRALFRALHAAGWRRHQAWMGASVKGLFQKYRERTPTKARLG